MAFNHEGAGGLEQLLESLIKMVGNANQKVDSMQVRIGQLEWIIKEQQHELDDLGRGHIPVYSAIAPQPASADTQ